MHIDLFSQALMLGVAFLVFLALGYECMGNDSIAPSISRYHRRRWLHIAIIILGSAVFGFIMHAGVQMQFPQDDIPWESVVWVMPLGAALILLGYNIKHIKKAIAGIGGIAGGILLTLLLANNYYHYYPTLDALFSHSSIQSISAEATISSSQSGHTVFEEYYQPLSGQFPKGKLLPLNIPASEKFSPRQGRIYIPPALSNNDLIKLPVIVLLTGYPGKPEDWEQAGLAAIMDNFAAKHKGLAPIVAVVDFEGTKGIDTECVNSGLGAAETYLGKDVPSYLKKHYQASQSAADWTIAGYSAGGTCSSLVALRNPLTYQSYMNINGDAYPSLTTPAETLAKLFNGSIAAQNAHMPDLLLKKGNPQFATMNAWYFVAEGDNPLVVKRVTSQAILAAHVGLTVKQASVTGHHGFLVWKQGYQEGLPWIMNRLRFTNNEK